MKTSKLVFGMVFICLLMLGVGPIGFGGAQTALADDQSASKAAPETQKAVTAAKDQAVNATKAAKDDAAKTMHHAEKAMKSHHRRAHMAISHERVKAVQVALNKAGYSLKEDGIMGKKTRMALKKYQKENNLKANGRMNKATLKKLGVM